MGQIHCIIVGRVTGGQLDRFSLCSANCYLRSAGDVVDGALGPGPETAYRGNQATVSLGGMGLMSAMLSITASSECLRTL